MATTVARLQAVLSANTRDFDRSMDRSQGKMKRLGGAGKLLGGVLAGVVAVELKRSVEAAMEAEKSQVRLETAFKGAKVSIDPYRQAIERASDAAINLGFDDEALKDSLGSLIIATGDYSKAQDAANVAMDLARFKGIGLDGATKMLTMAMGGSQRAVKQLGINVPPVTEAYDKLKAKFQQATSAGGENITQTEKMALKTAKLEDKQATAAVVIDTVRKKVRGQADAYSKTASGEMEVFRAKVEELEEKLGKKLLPTFTNIVTELIKFTDWLDRLNVKMEKFGGLAGPNLIDLIKKADQWFGKWGLSTADLAKDFEQLWGWIKKIVDGIKWLIDHIPKIPKLPSIPNPFGDAKNRDFVPPGMQGPAGLNPGILDELYGARAMGLVLTSGLRPGAVTRHGTPSDHATGKAIDVAGSASQMARYFRWLIGQRDVKQAFYDPLGSIFGGRLSSYREGGHSNHVHVATYDRGGFLQPGWNLAYNGLGRPEAVGGGNVTINLPNYVGSKSELMSWLQNAAQQFRRQNGRSAF